MAAGLAFATASLARQASPRQRHRSLATQARQRHRFFLSTQAIMSGDPVRQFSDLTGADEDTAKQMLAASGGDLDAAIALHFDAAGGGAAAEPMDTEPAAPNPPPALPAESDDELVGSILSNARQEADGDEKATGNANAWSGKGQALGSSSAAEATDGGASSSSDGPAEPAAPAEPAVPQYGERRNAKKIRVIFWSDGFTVEDVTAEEAAAEAAAKAPVAPRRTGLATLSTEKERSPDKPMPKLPEVCVYAIYISYAGTSLLPPSLLH